MRKFLTLAISLLGCMVLAQGVTAQDGVGKIAYVNSQKIIQDAPGAKEARDSFERDMARYRTELKTLADSLQAMISDYEQKQVTLSPDAKRTREEAIRTKQAAYQQREQQLQEQASKRQNELVEPIMAKIQAVISDFRKEKGYALIFDAAGAGLVAADTTLDVTAQVLERLRTAAAVKPATTPPAAAAPVKKP